MSLNAQTDTAQIQGTVADSTNAIISGAQVTVTNLETGASSATTSDASGRFNFSALVRGRYKAEVHADGFESQVQNLALDVSQVQALNFHLNPGSVNSTVTVTDAAPLVNTTTSSTGAVIEGRQVTELPLNGRNFTQLALLVPGVTRGPYGADASGLNGNAETWRNSETGGAALSVNGLRAQSNNFELDGLDNNDALVNTIIFFPPVEATQQFRVTTSVAPAEFGRAGGAIVQSSIKSGTNQIHGSAFVFDRDQIFDASPNYFAPTKPAASFHRVQFGGTLGGPLWRDKLFMFGDYQGLRLKQPNGSSFQTVPTALERQGNFSELLSSASTITTSVPYSVVTKCNTAAGPKGTIYDPTTCLPFNGNIIPQSRQNQAAINYLNAFPLPNYGPDQGNNTLQNNYFTNPTQVQRLDDFDVRLDLIATHRDTLFVRYSYGQDVLIKGSLFPNLPAGSGSGMNPQHPRGEAVGYTHIFTANLVNEFRYGHIYDFYGYLPPFGNIPVSANLGIVNANRNSNLGGGAAINGGTLAYTGDGGQYTVPQSSNQFVDNLSWIHGKHSLKIGTSIEKRQVSFFHGSNNKGLFDFSGKQFTGFSMSDMVAGFAGSYSIGVADRYFITQNWETGYFAQDDWKVTPRLTLNLGLRYDLFTFPYEVNNNQSDFDLATQTLQVAGANGISRSIVHTNFKNFAPRVGFAYDLTGEGKTVLRGGYGIYYFLDRGGVGKQLSSNPDFAGSTSYSDVPTNGGYRITFSGQAPANDNNNQHATGSLPLPVFGQTVNRANPVNSSLISVDTNLPTPMVQQWNLQWQQQLMPSTSLNISYVGTASEHLLSWYNLNSQILGAAPNSKLYPALNSITRGEANGIGRYNGLQVFLNSRMAHGLQYTAAYTWSHTMDNSNGAFTTGTNSPGNRLFILPTGPDFKDNYGNSDQDQRNVFVFSALAELPFGRGKRFGSQIPWALDEIIGGWQLNTIASINSGTHFDVSTGDYFYTSPSGKTSLVSAGLNNRADLVQPVRYKKSIYEWFDTSSFVRPQVINPNGQTSTYIRPGTLGRNAMTGPGYRNVDMSLFKKFPITERVAGTFRAEAYNLTNTPAFTNPNGNLDSCGGTATAVCSTSITGVDSGSFGQINGTRIHSERQLQLAFEVMF
ncbi:TonB-dependent receptor [Edaphobacter paludis]|uniref:TonB-dependent receptor n=1 Tax=Edaphobacter paludis TaxID=3035702 RepID=A0AAU7D518_9BACT